MKLTSCVKNFVESRSGKILVLLCGIGIICVGVAGTKVLPRVIPNMETIEPISYFEEFRDGQVNVIYNDTRIPLENPVKTIEGVEYLSYTFVKDYLTDKIYYDTIENILTLTSLNHVYRITPGSSYAWYNGEYVEIPYTAILENQELYIPVNYVTPYGFEAYYGEDLRFYIVNDIKVARMEAVSQKRKVHMRTHPNNKAPIIDTVNKGEHLTVFSDSNNGYLKIKSNDGLIGYVLESSVQELGLTAPYETNQIPAYDTRMYDEDIKLVWDQITAPYTSSFENEKYEHVEFANVVSPTWFSFSDESGTLSSICSKEYIDAAKAKGLKVWPLMSHNFSEPQLTRKILTSTKARQKVINQILDYAKEYNFQGINIDIENVQPDFATEWVQFMRELYPQANKQGLTVSVDIYVPSNWSKHYSRDKVSEVVDYFIVMAYDQYWSGSESAGPVSSIVWTEESIIANLLEVPKEKLILAIPSYMRLWKERGDDLSSKAYSMTFIQNKIKEWGVSPVYDPETKLDYVEVLSNGSKYKVWLENVNSIKKRMELIEKYELAGFAMWKLGLETPDVWKALK